MAITDVFKRSLSGELKLSRGRIESLEPDGRVRVRFGPAGPEIMCDVLRSGDESASFYVPGIEVLVAWANESKMQGVILGAIGPNAAIEMHRTPPISSPTTTTDASAPLPGKPLEIHQREIVIEAGDELTLRCGEASIRITRDGKIVIRGEHILSRAKGTQRIKGGTVAIN